MRHTVTLGPGITATMHEQTGLDHLISLSYQARLETAPEYEQYAAYNLYVDRFGFLMAQTERLDGIDFALPSSASTPVDLLDTFRAWLALPGKVFAEWFSALDKIEPLLNDPALLPPGKVGKEDRADPLSKTGDESSATTSTAS